MIYNKTYSRIHLLKDIQYIWIREIEIRESKDIGISWLKFLNEGFLLQVINPSFSVDF